MYPLVVMGGVISDCTSRCVALGSVHTATTEQFGNAALFQRLSLPSTLISHENGAF